MKLKPSKKLLTAARAVCKSIGMTLRYDADYEEYQVNFRGGREATTYYTNSLSDALDTAQAMHQTKTKKGGRS